MITGSCRHLHRGCSDGASSLQDFVHPYGHISAISNEERGTVLLLAPRSFRPEDDMILHSCYNQDT